MQILSSNALWQAFGRRALACTAHGGAGLGESNSTMGRIGDGTSEACCREWTQTGEQGLTHA